MELKHTLDDSWTMCPTAEFMYFWKRYVTVHASGQRRPDKFSYLQSQHFSLLYWSFCPLDIARYTVNLKRDARTGITSFRPWNAPQCSCFEYTTKRVPLPTSHKLFTKQKSITLFLALLFTEPFLFFAAHIFILFIYRPLPHPCPYQHLYSSFHPLFVSFFLILAFIVLYLFLFLSWHRLSSSVSTSLVISYSYLEPSFSSSSLQSSFLHLTYRPISCSRLYHILCTFLSSVFLILICPYFYVIFLSFVFTSLY